MGKLTKRIIEALDAKGGPDIFEWDSELRGFGVRARATGSKTYLVQYRNTEGRTRRLRPTVERAMPSLRAIWGPVIR